MDNKSAVAKAFVSTAEDIDERRAGYREDLIKAIGTLLRTRDQHATDQSRRNAIEDQLAPIAKSLQSITDSGAD